MTIIYFNIILSVFQSQIERLINYKRRCCNKFNLILLFLAFINKNIFTYLFTLINLYIYLFIYRKIQNKKLK